MSEFLLDNVRQSVAMHGTPNVPSQDGSDYYDFLANVIAPVIPGLETVTDEEMVGDGFSRTLRDIRNYYWSNKPWAVSGLLNDHISSILMNSWQGGAVTTTPRTSPSKDIAAVQNVVNSNPKLLSLYRKLGGERFINSSFAPNNFSITQEGEGRPAFNFDMLSTGHYLDDIEIDAGIFDEADINAAPEYEYFHGAATEITATDGVETYNWTADGELISLSIEGSNNVDIRRRPGDPFKTAGNHNSGAIARKIRNGKLTGGVRLKVDLDASLRTFKAMVAARKLTGLAIVFNGFNKIGATGDDFEFELKVPRAGFQMIEGDTDQDFGALALNIQPLRDTVSNGYFTNRTRTNKIIVI